MTIATTSKFQLLNMEADSSLWKSFVRKLSGGERDRGREREREREREGERERERGRERGTEGERERERGWLEVLGCDKSTHNIIYT